MRQFPIFLTLDHQPVLVVGGTEAAAAKLRLLLKTEARIDLIAEEVTPEIAELIESGAVTRLARPFRQADVRGRRLVYAASGDEALDARVSTAARMRDIPVNVVDRPDLSSFITPALVDRDPILVAVSSSAAAPVLAREVRIMIERMLPARFGELARLAGSFRGAVKGTLKSGRERRRFWEGLFAGPVPEAVLKGERALAQAETVRALNGSRPKEAGTVHLVGAGPGDPDLLTLKAHRLLQQADVILYDQLVGDGILDLARRDARRIFVGKRKGRHSLPQAEINALLVKLARGGETVVRLKGGDPLIFGRGGEELAAVEAAGLRAEVVPGITAALGCAAAAGLPLTHRDHAQAVTFMTGHRADGGGEAGGKDPARLGQTLVVYMGLAKAAEISRSLQEGGHSPQTPVAVISNGTRPDQEVRTGKLSDLGRLARSLASSGPALLVVGEVAQYARNNRPAEGGAEGGVRGDRPPSLVEVASPVPFSAAL